MLEQVTLDKIAQYGVASLAIAGLVYVSIFLVKAFLAHMKQREEAMAVMQTEFTSTVRNHFSHSAEVLTELRGSNDRMVEALNRLEAKL